jgi:hypothetical protein
MTDTEIRQSSLRAGLIEELQLARAVERDIFTPLDPVIPDQAPADGG